MKIKICQMGETYHSPLTFRILINENALTWFKDNKLEVYVANDASYYIKSNHIVYGNFLFGGTI